MEELIKKFMNELAQKLADEVVEWCIDLTSKRQDYFKKGEKEMLEKHSEAIKKVFGEPK